MMPSDLPSKQTAIGKANVNDRDAPRSTTMDVESVAGKQIDELSRAYIGIEY
jgi:hypothetical protein